MELALGNPLILFKILLPLNYDSIVNYCLTHREAVSVCRDRLFWEKKAELDLNIPRTMFRETTLSPNQRYLQLWTLKGGLTYGSERYIYLKEFVSRAIRQNRPDLVEYAIKLGYNDKRYHLFLYESALQGNQERVDYYLTLIPDYNSAANGALEGDHRELFDYIRLLAPPNYKWRWDDLVASALSSNNIELYEYVKSLTPTSYRVDDNILLLKLLQATINTNNQHYFNALLVLLRPDYLRFLNDLAETAIYAENKEFFNYIRSAPVNYEWNWNKFAEAAIYTNNLQIFDYIISLAPANYQWNWYRLAVQAINFSETSFLKHIYSLAPLDYDWSWNDLAGTATYLGRKYFFDYIRLLAPPNTDWNWQYLASKALLNNQKEMFDYLHSLAPTDYPWDWQDLIKVAGLKNHELTNYLTLLV